MRTISLYTLMNGKTYPESGELLYNLIEKKMNNEEQIVLDMKGVTSLPSMFLNVSIGKFIEKYGYPALKKKISFSNISSSQAARIVEYAEKVAK